MYNFVNLPFSTCLFLFTDTDTNLPNLPSFLCLHPFSSQTCTHTILPPSILQISHTHTPTSDPPPIPLPLSSTEECLILLFFPSLLQIQFCPIVTVTWQSLSATASLLDSVVMKGKLTAPIYAQLERATALMKRNLTIIWNRQALKRTRILASPKKM